MLVVLTVKGKAAAIVQDVAAYQRLLDIAPCRCERSYPPGTRQRLPVRTTGLRKPFKGWKARPTGVSWPEAKKSKRPLRQLLYGRKPHVYRVIYEIDERSNWSSCSQSGMAPGSRWSSKIMTRKSSPL
jgi:hypothetical protein